MTTETNEDKDNRVGDALARAIVAVTEPLTVQRLTTYDLADALETDPRAIREALRRYEWAYAADDDEIEWVFDRWLVFQDTPEEAIERYPERYDEDDFYALRGTEDD